MAFLLTLCVCTWVHACDACVSVFVDVHIDAWRPEVNLSPEERRVLKELATLFFEAGFLIGLELA